MRHRTATHATCGRRRRATALGLTIAALLLVTGRLTAHDFWIESSAFIANVGTPVRIHLRVGERFVGEPIVRNEAMIERFVLAGPGAEKPVIGRPGMDPAGLLRLESPGLWFVGYVSKPSSLELAAKEFEQYLREEGLERIIAERAKRQESAAPGRETFSRSVKALLRAGGEHPQNGGGYERMLGLPLELALEADPVTAPGKQLPLRLLYRNQPLVGTQIVAYRKAAGAAGEGEVAVRTRTDQAGRVVVPMAPGWWLVKAMHMTRTEPGAAADWHSTWTALTFEIPG